MVTISSKHIVCPKCNGNGGEYDRWDEGFILCNYCNGKRVVIEKISHEVIRG